MTIEEQLEDLQRKFELAMQAIEVIRSILKAQGQRISRLEDMNDSRG